MTGCARCHERRCALHHPATGQRPHHMWDARDPLCAVGLCACWMAARRDPGLAQSHRRPTPRVAWSPSPPIATSARNSPSSPSPEKAALYRRSRVGRRYERPSRVATRASTEHAPGSDAANIQRRRPGAGVIALAIGASGAWGASSRRPGGHRAPAVGASSGRPARPQRASPVLGGAPRSENGRHRPRLSIRVHLARAPARCYAGRDSARRRARAQATTPAATK